MQIIRKNFTLKLLSVSLALIGWAYVRFASNPLVATHFEQQLSVPIVSVNLAPGLIAHYTEREAVVTVIGKRGSPPVKPDEVKAVLDLSNKLAGVYNVPVDLVAPQIAVQSLSPASVTLTVERVEQRAFPVVLHYTGGSHSGIVVSDPQLTPRTIEVYGPVSALAQIASVRVDVPMATSPHALDEMIRPVAVSANDVEVPEVTVAPDLVRVRMQFVAGSGSEKK